MDTILMKQMDNIKSKYPDCIVLLHSFNYYEAFRNDAQIISELCGTPLATNKNNVRVTGFPAKELNKMLIILVTQNGKTIAIVEEKLDRLK